MCGIFGLTKFKEDHLDLARESLKTLNHRGPDQWNDFYDEKIYIGHRRLSIIDLSINGIQPMMSNNKKIIITVNGEIYNFLELKKELLTKYKFKSTSDSEVILNGYIEWGLDKLINKIDGMYAISIYDKEKGELFLIRDRVGIKPLFYSDLNNQITWSSELKAIQKFYSNQPFLEIDFTALYDFLTYRFIPTPKTLYKKIYKLEPGHYLKIDISKNKIEKRKYWELNLKNNNHDLKTAKNKIFKLVNQSVNEQMISDVPVGFFLSGGLDSSILVALASKSSSQIKTFTIGFKEESHDETLYAKKVADHLSSKHHQKIISENEVNQIFNKIKKWYDEPFADTSCFPTFFVSQFAKQYSTVVLTGDGGDEIFGGYNWYKSFKKLQITPLKKLSIIKPIADYFGSSQNKIGKVFRKISILLSDDDVEKYGLIRGSLTKKEKIKYRKKWGIDNDYDDFWYYRKFYNKNLTIYKRLQFVDFNTYLPDDILTKVDRVSMAVSLECRVPYLKKEIIEYCFSLPDKVRLHNDELKGLMRRTFNEILPKEILNRDKKGFSIPLYNWNVIMNKRLTKQERVLKEFDV